MLQGTDRAYRQAVKVARRCDPQAEWGDAFPDKPRWMRWPTYERLAEHHDLMALLGITHGTAREVEARAAYAAWRAEQRGR